MAMQCQLWMGSLEPNMTESFILAAFHRMGQRPLAVKVMRNKFTGEPAGYAFIHFQTDEESVDAMHKLNGKPIPGTFPVVRFRLNTASREARANMQQEREFSVWVGDLSPDVDDYSLYRVFATKYSSIKTAKVILDSSGYTKGYGFVRFGNEEEQRNALYAMNGYTGLGTKPLKICTAVPKPKGAVTTQSSTATASNATYSSGTEYSQYYDPSAYWQNYSAWSGYYGQGDQAAASAQAVPAADAAQTAAVKAQTDELALVGTFPVVRFRLNTASREARANMQQEREFSVWVGDLSPDVDDYSLYRVFATKYSSIKTAKVILDSSGYTKGYGFVRFGNEEEQRNALYAMNGYTGLGTKPLKICTAVPKPKGAVTTQSSTATASNATYSSGTEYSQYYDPSAYWQNYSAWSGYYGQGDQAAASAQAVPAADAAQTAAVKAQTDELALVGTFPVVRFRLNTASREARANMQQEREFSVWVGDLSPDVDDYSLYRVFATKYSSIKTAKVILDSSGYTKGYGFVRFGNEEEQRNALYAMNGYTGLGTKPLKICTAVPKPKGAVTTQSSTATASNATYSSGTEYSQYYDPSAYWQNYSAWSGYYGQGDQAAASAQAVPAADAAQTAAVKAQTDELALVEHKKTIDVEQMNQEFLNTELSLWDSLEASHWLPHDVVEAH